MTFDVAAIRKELALYDSQWATCDHDDRVDAYRATRDLLGQALATIDAGWPEPTGDVVERAASAAFEAAGGSGELDLCASRAHKDWTTIARAVLRSAGRPAQPIVVTDAVVEEAAIALWCADGTETKDTWDNTSDSMRPTYCRDARAVLEYAASLGATVASDVEVERWRKDAAAWGRLAIERGEELIALKSAGAARRTGAPSMLTTDMRQSASAMRGTGVFPSWFSAASVADLLDEATDRIDALKSAAPAGQCAADRLTGYRCAALTRLMSSPADPTAYARGHALLKRVADGAEAWAHAMLAAEKEPTHAR